ncbi:MAG: sugar phosphate isomerase/epimerase [Planctomycetota bacterium]
MKGLRVGVDSYSLKPLGLTAFEVLDWVARNGGEGVQFSEINLPAGRTLDAAFLQELGHRAREKGLYLEWGGGQHIPFDLQTWQPKDLLPINRQAAAQAQALGARVVRSCSGGLMRWSDSAPPTEALLRAMVPGLRAQMPMLADHGIVLAIELHFEFTTFELARLFEMCDARPGGPLGICLDTMNLLIMLEDPHLATQRILPWVVATHVKDGALKFGSEGLIAFPTAIGEGQIDLARIVTMLSGLERSIHLSLEAHGGRFSIPLFDATFLTRFPDLTAIELSRLVRLARDGERRIAEGTLAVLEREDWPLQCEARVRADLLRLGSIAAGVRSSGDHLPRGGGRVGA